MEKQEKKSIFENPILSTKVKSANVKTPELLFGYFIGPFGALLASGIFTSFLNRYWTDVLFANYKVDGELPSYITTFLTLLPLLSAILIVAGNLVVGQLIERTKTKAGKARPWLLLSSVFLAVACVVMFIAPMGNGTDTPVTTMVLTAIAYNVYYSIAYPMYNTANSTLVPVSTRNSSQRSLLASFTNFAHLAVMGAGGMVFPFVVSWWLGGWDNPSKNAWMITFIAVGVFTFLVVILQYYFTRERVTEESMTLEASKATSTAAALNEKKNVPVKQQLKAVVTDKFWWIIIIFYLIFQTAGSFKNLSITYFCTDQFAGTAIGGSDGSSAMGILNILGAVPMAVAMAFIWPLAHKFGKRIVVMVGLIIGLAGGILAGMFPSNFYIVAVGVALKSFGSAPACYMILAMIADVLDHIEAKHGFRCDGLTMSIYSSIMAASAPIATGIFNAISNGGSNSTANTISYIWIETIVYGICAVLLIFFFVEKFLKDDRVKIRERQKAEVLASGGEWIEPEEMLKIQEAEANAAAEEARKAELKAKCEKKGLSYEEEEAKYQAKQEEKRKAAEAKKAKKAEKVKKDES